MVTGNKIDFTLLKTDPQLSKEVLKSSHAFIGLSAASFSVAIVNANHNAVLLLAQYAIPLGLSPDEQLGYYSNALKEIPYSLESCLSTEVYLGNEKFSLIPEDFHQKSQERQLLSYTCQLENSEQVQSDYWAQSQCLLVFAAAQPIKDWLVKHFSHPKLKHQATAYYNLYQQFSDKSVFLLLYVGQNTAHFYMGRSGKTLFYNHFEFNTEEDLLYFVLYTLEQNRLIPADLTLYLAGYCLKGDKLHTLYSQHLAQVEDLPLSKNLTFSNNMSALDLRQNINLIGAI